MITLYGLHKCGTCKKAKAWLEERDVAYRFHDWQADGVPEALVAGWLERLGPGGILNKAGYTWRGLSAADQAAIDSGDAGLALPVFLANPSLIKRPAIDDGDSVTFGFTKAVQADLPGRVGAVG